MTSISQTNGVKRVSAPRAPSNLGVLLAHRRLKWLTAVLQAATAPGLPVMLRTNANAGHGFSTDKDESLEQQVDILSFMFAQLGIQV